MSTSALSDLEQGKITPAQFVEAAAADIKKDAAIFNQVPGTQPMEAWALDRLGGFLSTRVTPTVAGLIVGALKSELGVT